MPTAETTVSDYERERGKPRPDVLHSFIQPRLCYVLSAAEAEYTTLSEVDLVLDGRKIVPDLSVYPAGHFDWTHDEPYLTDPPLLTVLIATTGQPLADLEEAAQFLLEVGVQSCWLVQPSLQTITIFGGDGRSSTYAEGTVKDPATGIEVTLDEVFRGTKT